MQRKDFCRSQSKTPVIFIKSCKKRLHFEVKSNYIKMEYFSKYLKELFFKYEKSFLLK